MVASKLFVCHQSCLGEQQQQCVRLLERLVSLLAPLRSLELLLPQAAEAPLALSLLPQSLQRLQALEASRHLRLMLPALREALNKEAATRKAAVMCLVELYLCIGEDVFT